EAYCRSRVEEVNGAAQLQTLLSKHGRNVFSAAERGRPNHAGRRFTASSETAGRRFDSVPVLGWKASRGTLSGVTLGEDDDLARAPLGSSARAPLGSSPIAPTG